MKSIKLGVAIATITLALTGAVVAEGKKSNDMKKNWHDQTT
jgi:hypothetical protein